MHRDDMAILEVRGYTGGFGEAAAILCEKDALASVRHFLSQ
jgi:hypothetical protein